MNPFDELTEHFDHHDVAFMQDPVPGYTAMRARCPVAHSDRHGGFWIVADYDDLHNLYFDTDHFSSFIPTIPNSGHGERRFPLTMSDPPEHGLYRQIVQPWFTQSKMAEYEPEIRRRVTRLIDAFIERGEADLFWDFARKLPASVMAFDARTRAPLWRAPVLVRSDARSLLNEQLVLREHPHLHEAEEHHEHDRKDERELDRRGSSLGSEVSSHCPPPDR